MPAYHPSIFRYTQATASADWVIQHNLGTNGSTGVPIVDCFIDFTDPVTSVVSSTKIIPAITTMNNANSVTLTFSEPQTGFAMIIV